MHYVLFYFVFIFVSRFPFYHDQQKKTKQKCLGKKMLLFITDIMRWIKQKREILCICVTERIYVWYVLHKKLI